MTAEVEGYEQTLDVLLSYVRLIVDNVDFHTLRATAAQIDPSRIPIIDALAALGAQMREAEIAAHREGSPCPSSL